MITSTQIVLQRLDVRINTREREKYKEVKTRGYTNHFYYFLFNVLFSFPGFDSFFIQFQIILYFFPGVLL